MHFHALDSFLVAFSFYVICSAGRTTPSNLPIFRYPREQMLQEKNLQEEEYFREGGEDSQEFGFFDGMYGDLTIQDGVGQPFTDHDRQGKEAPDESRDHPSFDVDYQSNNIEGPRTDSDFCPDQPESKYYCRNLRDGAYFDPWNPWCGYIQCEAGVAHRKCCHSGTWMGLSAFTEFSTKHMCRKRLPRTFSLNAEAHDAQCPEITDYQICKNAEQKENAKTRKENDTNSST